MVHLKRQKRQNKLSALHLEEKKLGDAVNALEREKANLNDSDSGECVQSCEQGTFENNNK